jgi:sulfur carrier protein ThiS
MRIFLGGHLNFYHPQKGKWLEVDLKGPTPLVDLLNAAGVPLSEVQLVAINGEVVELSNAWVSEGDQVKVFSPVGGG